MIAMDKIPNEAPKKSDGSPDTRELLKNFKLTRKAIVARKGNSSKHPKQAAAITVTPGIIQCGWGSGFGQLTLADRRPS